MALAKIVYASMTGNTEEIADIVAEKLEALGLDVDIDECTTVDASDFADADIAIVASYTYGDGDYLTKSLISTMIYKIWTFQVKSSVLLVLVILSTMNFANQLMILKLLLLKRQLKKALTVSKLIWPLKKTTSLNLKHLLKHLPLKLAN
jgi:flavorubredoxin